MGSYAWMRPTRGVRDEAVDGEKDYRQIVPGVWGLFKIEKHFPGDGPTTQLTSSRITDDLSHHHRRNVGNSSLPSAPSRSPCRMNRNRHSDLGFQNPHHIPRRL